jgi:hypothetical protein
MFQALRWKEITPVYQLFKCIEVKEAGGARWGWGWGISPGKTHMRILLVLGEPKRLEARTDKIFIGWLGLPNQPLPQFLYFMV